MSSRDADVSSKRGSLFRLSDEVVQNIFTGQIYFREDADRQMRNVVVDARDRPAQVRVTSSMIVEGVRALNCYAAPADGQHRVCSDEEIVKFIFTAMSQQNRKQRPSKDMSSLARQAEISVALGHTAQRAFGIGNR